MKRLFGLIIIAMTIGGCTYSVNDALKPQIEETNHYFETRPFTALVNFEVHGFYYVDPKGKPLSDEDQSKRKASKGLFTKDYTVEKGAQGHIIGVYQKDERVIIVGVSEGSNMLAASWNPSSIEIHHSRPITKDDLTHQAIARALSSLLVIEGLEPGSELDDVLNELEEPIKK